jgi:cyclophilin family peptidyl-prolyl cis-trans isomerase
MSRSVLAVLAALLVALVLGACGGDDEAGSQAEVTATPTTAPAQAGCEQVAAPEPKGEQTRSAPDLELDPAKTYVARVLTSCGEFEITLDAERAPKTGGSFVSLARDRYFDGLTFHRIVPGFVIQGGDPLGTGEGGPGYSVTEKPPADLKYEKGVVAMAKTAVEDPGTSGSQFFVVTGEDAGLPAEYALLGRVTKGMEVVDAIGVVDVGPGDVPAEPVVIRQVKVEER